MNNKKQLILSIGLTLVLVLMIVGISYAAFQFNGPGSKLNTITTGAITMEYTESDNVINMTGALPTTDATGKVRLTEGEYLDFTVKSAITGTTNINWEIAAEDITTASKKIDGKYIKLYLTKLDDSNNESQVMAPKVFTVKTSENTKTGRPSGMMSLATDTMSSSETNKYRLRMYVDESYNPQGDGGDLSFSVKVNVYGKVKEEPKGSKLKAYATASDLENDNPPETDFHTSDYWLKTTSIVTKNDNEVPTTAIESWDLSEARDGSVMAYSEDDGTGNGTYKVTIGGKEGIIANESMVNYFSHFDAITSIDLSAFDTSKTTDMSRMFSGSGSLTNLNLSNFDTSSVINMSEMFLRCTSLKSLNVSSFDTSNVVNMKSMFSACQNLTSLVIDNFDTSKVTDMSNMFRNCNNLTNLDVSNFNTSKVTDLSRMFASCHSLTSLDLSNFDTSQVTNMNGVFFECKSLTKLNISTWDTSNVTTMGYRNQMGEGMFAGCSSLTSLDLTSFDTSNVTNMSEMFNGCSKLTEITVSSKWVIGSSTNITYMFDGCGTDHVTIV